MRWTTLALALPHVSHRGALGLPASFVRSVDSSHCRVPSSVAFAKRAVVMQSEWQKVCHGDASCNALLMTNCTSKLRLNQSAEEGELAHACIVAT